MQIIGIRRLHDQNEVVSGVGAGTWPDRLTAAQPQHGHSTQQTADSSSGQLQRTIGKAITVGKVHFTISFLRVKIQIKIQFIQILRCVAKRVLCNTCATFRTL